ncbi:NACHT, LRR and PYD domains-containing protein 3-like isoform X1 [Podarcis lilfordi]|uniref:NACHT, LRR and PYD domains-containing protein 3-like isoform X1 n=1 Tax=Podarcis lilfordi TaxID=74358 RepID=A0AA35JN70_9SAUR|nr:NACHT, LRR and PYD domains-containing protein 3-like isoform X1 [Podarcis lilfordi]
MTPPMQSDYREKYREHIREKYQSPERRLASHGVYGPPNEKYEQLIIANGDRRETEILHRPWRHSGIMSEQMVAVPTEALFEVDNDGPQTVVLLGGAGTGKTTLARKILLDWAAGRLFPGRFDYLFYLRCGQLNLVKVQADLADLILNGDPELREREEIMELLENPVKLLFIIDGFHELTCSIEHQEDNPSVDPREKKPVGVLLSALFHRALLPEACLLITTRPSSLESLRNCLQSERCIRLLGFSEEGKEEYFLKVFGDKKLATQALSYVKGDEALFALSFVPNLCWVLCTVMKQQLDRGKEDLVPVSEKLTAVYALYLSRLTESPCSSSGQWNLRGLCSLAADGIRKNKTLFKAEEIQKQSSGHLGSLPPALFQKDPGSEGLYRFLHLSVQEFLAALFYVLEDTPKNPETMKQDLELSLEGCGKDPGDLTLFAQFIFSLLNREIMEYLKEQFGWQISPAVNGGLLDWFKTDTQIKSDYPNYCPLERFHYLYAIQEEEFAQCALDHLTEVTMGRLTFTPLDQAVLSFCVQNCLHLEALCLYGSLFLSKKPEGEELPGHLSHPCQPDQKTQERSAVYLLCQALKDPNNKIRKLELRDCGLTSVSGRDFSTVFSTSQKLTELELGWNLLLGDQGVQLLCEGLKHPNCKLQSLGLDSCNLSAASCQDLIPVLSTSRTLMKLNLECNKVGDAGVKLLSEGLRHPNCVLQTLLLDTNELSPACCGDFSSILSTSQTLTELALEYNGLEDAGVRLLCEGLKQPSCKLQKLRLARCNITAASCEDLSSALAVRQTLTELVVECNELRDPGVKLLCRGLKHPHCKLQLLNLYNCDLTAACCADLASVLSSNQTLTELFLGGNQLGDSGVQLLCEGLKHPKCTLQKLCLCSTEITAAGWGEICSALSTNQMLEDIDVWNNPLGDSGMRLLCEALKHPGCKLQILSLWNCEFTSASCRDLCSALSSNQSLKKLKLGGNKLGDSGVKMLCEGLKDPSCGLEAIELDIDELSEDTVRELSSMKRIKPDLVIDT